jgi:hypothetical protein
MKFTKVSKKASAALMQMVVMATSFSASAAGSAYYVGRRGAYAQGKNKSYLAEPSLGAVSHNLLKPYKAKKKPTGPIKITHANRLEIISSPVKELLVVDHNIKDYEQFSSLARPGVVLVEIPKGVDGLAFLMDKLAQYQNLQAVHLFSHANAGELLLGNTQINSEVLANHAAFAKVVNSTMKVGGDFLLYGCELGKGQKGDEFLEIIKNKTHADIAASNNLTGNTQNNGDWNLEVQKGNIETQPLANSIAMKDFTEVLQNVTFQVGSWTVVNAGANNDRFTPVGSNKSSSTAIDALVKQTVNGVERTLKVDGAYNSIKADNSYGISFGFSESALTISFTDGSVFTPVSIEIYTYQGDPATITTNLGGSINANIKDAWQVGYAAQTFDLSILPQGVTSLTITNNSWAPFVVNTNSGFMGAIKKITFKDIGITANAKPVVTASGGTTAHLEGTPVVIDNGLTLSDADHTTLASATVTISGNFQSGQDVLAFTNNGTTMGNVTGSYAAGVLTLSSAGNSATLAQWQAALRSVTYNNTASAPNTSNRTISFVVNDGTDNSTATTKTVSVTDVNDPPTLTATALSPTFTEKGTAVNVFAGAAVSTVESGQAIVSLQVRVNNLANGSSEILTVDGTDITLTNGTTATTATNALSASVSVASGVATVTLSKTAGISTAATQTLINGITYRNTSNAPTGTSRTVTLSSIGDNGGVANGGISAVSVNIPSTVTIVAVNDAPTLAGGPYSFGSINASETSNGTLVSTILAGLTYADLDAGALSGIAITATSGGGAWQYSTDGNTWTGVGSVSASSALLLTSTTQLRYVPSGAGAETPSLTFRAWDRTSGTASVNGVRGLSNTNTNGGTTAFSTGTAQASLSVLAVPVNTAAPVITGTATMGNVLSSNTGTWTNASSYTYQWYRADDNSGTNLGVIASATNASYTLTTSDAHKYLRVVVTANNGTGGTATVNSDYVAIVNSAPVNSAAPSISGTAAVGNALSTSNGTWSDADGDGRTYSYQWYRADDNVGTNLASIAGANSASYTLTSSDAHKYLRVVVTANDGKGGTTAANSTYVAVANSAPVNSVAPSISGTAAVGNALSTTNGTWSDADGDGRTYSYQWYRADDNAGTNLASIAGANSASYTLTSSDAHKYLRVVVTANDGKGGTTTANSAYVAVANSAPVNSVAPSISGTAAVGNALSTTNGTWSDADGDGRTYSYQWYRADDNAGTNLASIAGTNSASYTLTSSDAHKYLRVVVTANDGKGGTTTANSAYVAVANSLPTDISLSSLTVNQSAGANAVVGTISTTDLDATDTHSYTLVAGAGSTNNASFNISGSSLRANDASVLPAGNYTIRIRATDNFGGNFEKTFTVTVADNVAPTVVISSSLGASGTATTTSPVPFTVTFSEAVNDFTVGDITVTNGTVGGFAGSGSNYSFNVVPNGNGNVVVNVTANVATDAAGNGNTAATQFVINYQNVLPVTLVDFTVKIDGNHARLQWQTAMEQNNGGFEIYRSGDDKRFVRLTEIVGRNVASLYSFIDKNPLNGNNYYRLVQLDRNGTSTELGEKVLNFDLGSVNVAVFPNPSSGKTKVKFGANRFRELIVAAVDGRIINQQKLSIGQLEAELDLSAYPNGTYFVKLLGDKESNVVKVVKK